ncbi:MAG: squalene/phytoene synthase family protein [Rhodothermales bacterium]
MAEVATRNVAGWPVPLAPERWPKADQAIVKALWHWLFALKTEARTQRLDEKGAQVLAEQIQAHASTTGLGLNVDTPYRQLVNDKRIPLQELVQQARVAWRWHGAQRFQQTRDLNAFADAWGGSQARMLASVAGVNTRWTQTALREWGRAYFFTSRLLTLDDDLARDQCFFALDEMERQGVSIELLRRDRDHADVNTLLWKTVIRAQDAYAQALPLVYDVEGGLQRALKESWLGGLEALRQVQKQGYRLEEGILPLPITVKAQVWFQARFARTTFKRR